MLGNNVSNAVFTSSQAVASWDLGTYSLSGLSLSSAMLFAGVARFLQVFDFEAFQDKGSLRSK